jgi:hypothetical protein
MRASLEIISSKLKDMEKLHDYAKALEDAGDKIEDALKES